MTPQSLFTLDLNRCTGCSACAIACRIENDVGDGVDWRRIQTFNSSHVEGAPVYHLSLACNHCLDPACMKGCPALAYTKDADTGAVLLDGDKCIGCGYCRWVCPYDAPQMNSSTGVMEKCTFCSHRIGDGLDPACVAACPVDALGYERAGVPGPHDVPGFPDTGLRPAIRIEPRRPSGAVAAMVASPPIDGSLVETSPRLRLSRLRAEWPLLLFSLGAAFLVAGFAAAQSLGASVHPLLFPLVGAVVMNVSLLHLGRPLRAWRAMLNVRGSWVSREIVSFSSFIALASIVLAWPTLQKISLLSGLPALPAVARGGVILLGFVATGCIDLVYRVPGQRYRAVPHSAMTMLTALYLFGLLAWEPVIAIVAGVAKLAAYPLAARERDRLPWAVTLVRVVLGFVWPLAVVFAEPDAFAVWLLAGPVVAEGVDRARFYAELDFSSPERQIEDDLASFAGPRRVESRV